MNRRDFLRNIGRTAAVGVAGGLAGIVQGCAVHVQNIPLNSKPINTEISAPKESGFKMKPFYRECEIRENQETHDYNFGEDEILTISDKESIGLVKQLADLMKQHGLEVEREPGDYRFEDGNDSVHISDYKNDETLGLGDWVQLKINGSTFNDDAADGFMLLADEDQVYGDQVESLHPGEREHTLCRSQPISKSYFNKRQKVEDAYKQGLRDMIQKIQDIYE